MIVRVRRFCIASVVGALTLGLLLTGCAPEGTPPTGGGLRPGEIAPAPQPAPPQPADTDKKGSQHIVDEVPSEDFGGRQPVEVEKVHDLPESFPVDDVRIPENAIIDHAGERDNGSWFAVLKFSSMTEAKASLDMILADFTLELDDSDPESLYRQYSHEGFAVEALAFTEEDMIVLSLDVSPKA